MLDSEKASSSSFASVTLENEDKETSWLPLHPKFNYWIQRPIETHHWGMGKLQSSLWEVALALSKHWQHCTHWKENLQEQYPPPAVHKHSHPILYLLLTYTLACP